MNNFENPNSLLLVFDRMCESILIGQPSFIWARSLPIPDCEISSIDFATALNRLGVRKGDKVMLYITNSANGHRFLRDSKDWGCGCAVAPIYTSF